MTRRLNLNASPTHQIRLASSGGSLKFENAEGEKLPRFEILAYTGQRIDHPGFWDGIVIDLAGVDLREGKPRSFLQEHDSSKILGHIESARIENGKLYVTAVMSASGYPEADRAVSMARKGYMWEASVGMDGITTMQLRAGEKTMVNGQEVVGPLEIVTKSRLREVSLVAAGADPDTETRLAAKRAGSNKETRMGFEDWLKGKGKVLADLTDDEKTTLQAEYDAEQDAAQGKGDEVAAGAGTTTTVQAASRGRLAASNGRTQIQASNEELAANIARQNKILQLCGQANLELAAEAIRENWSPELTELKLFKLRASSAPAAHVRTGSTPASIGLQLSAALTANVMKDEDRVRRFGAQAVEAGDRLKIGASIRKTVQLYLAAHGQYSPSMDRNDELAAARDIDRQYRYGAGGSRQIQAASASTIPLSGVFSGYMEARVREQYDQEPLSWREFCSTRRVNDFKESKSYLMQLSGVMREVAKDGTIQDVSLQESQFSSRAKTLGAILNITEEMYYNDNLGALDQIPQMFAINAAQMQEEDAWKTLFSMIGTEISAANKNYIEGADSAFSIDSLSALETLLREQRGANGRPINARANKVLVPPKYAAAATVIFKADKLNETTVANKPKAQDNPHTGKFRVVDSPYMSLAEYVTPTGSVQASRENFAILGNRVMPVEMVFVDGVQEPTVEVLDAPNDVLGFSVRAVVRYGAGKGDARGIAWSKGGA